MIDLLGQFPNLVEVVRQIYLQLILLGVLFVLRLLGVDLYKKVFWLIRFFACLLRYTFFREPRNKKILLFIDCDDGGVSRRNLSRSISASFGGVKVIALENAELFLEWPIFNWNISSCFIFITDVTPLSANPKVRKNIQDRIKKYVDNGGCLILGHDALYRRAKNDVFQQIAGCEVSKFTRYDHKKVKYTKFIDAEDSHYRDGLMEGLPAEMNLDDREYVTGNWSSDVSYVYVLREAAVEGVCVPLMTCRVIGNGVVIWCNSGDSTSQGPPHALASPDEGLISSIRQLVQNCRKNILKP